MKPRWRNYRGLFWVVVLCETANLTLFFGADVRDWWVFLVMPALIGVATWID